MKRNRRKKMIFSNKENVAEEKLDDKPEVVVSPTSLSSPKKVPQTPILHCKAVLSRMDKLRKHIEKKHPGKKFNPAFRMWKRSEIWS